MIRVVKELVDLDVIGWWVFPLLECLGDFLGRVKIGLGEAGWVYGVGVNFVGGSWMVLGQFARVVSS